VNVAESIKLQELLGHLIGEPDPEGNLVSSAQAQAAAFFLTTRARMTLAAGLQPDDVRRRWHARPDLSLRTRHRELLEVVEVLRKLIERREIIVSPLAGKPEDAAHAIGKLKNLLMRER
jgi:hypothetical protein